MHPGPFLLEKEHVNNCVCLITNI